jgi:hypothetical protein
LIERNYFVYKKWMIALLQMQNTIRFIKYIQRSKPYANQFRNVLNANIGYSFNVEAVYLPSQWSYPLKQGNTATRVFIGTFEIFIALGHNNLKAYSFARFIRFQLITTGSFVLVSDISVGAFGKKHRLVHKMCPNPCFRPLTDDIW